ncbi:hypothetical protein PRZ48_004330 [Zasmidium cellare]|uniref:Uncharacterized protein n=1 Tax=Zasmidium cellare TaxID=395010 RepID=A0ABR0EQI5_ZASCE|nr:hypothetical protein PRZ48_004330 [Zasmidium cellare]
MKYSYAAVLSASAALAQTVVENVNIGVGPAPSGNNSDFDTSSSRTTTSQTMGFSLYWPAPDNSPAPPVWQWRISLNEADATDSDVPNARVLNTVYDFSFPNGDTLNQAVADNSGQLNTTAFCVTVVESLFPANVINKWNDDVLSNGSEEESCQTPLRKRCTGAIEDAIRNSDPDENGCRGSNVDLSTVRQCEWVFDGGYQASTYNLVGNQSAADNSSFPIRNGGGFTHVTSPVYDATNRTWFEQEDLRMHMIIIDSGSTYTPLCMRVNSSVKADSVATGANTGAASTSISLNSWLLLAAGFVALAYAL